jgi:copper(I)-binding protein
MRRGDVGGEQAGSVCARIGCRRFGRVGEITVSDAWSLAMAMDHGDEATTSATNAAIYLQVTNTGDTPDRLVPVAAEGLGTVELHQTAIDANSVMRMAPVDSLEIPASGRAGLETGGYHIMLIDVPNPPEPGDTILLTLIFERNGTVSVPVEVRNR